MKLFFLNLLMFVILFNSCKQQKNITNQENQKSTNKIILDSIITIAKTHSLYANNVNWKILKNEMLEKFKDNDSLSSLKAPIIHLLTTLKDHHGFATIGNTQYRASINRKRNVNYDYNNKNYTNTMSAIYNHYLKNDSIYTTLLDANIAYIQIPQIINNLGIDSISIEKTIEIRKKICALETHNPKGYIIDLRSNLGGNMYPMFSGLGILFPNLNLGGDTKDGLTFQSKWKLKEGNLHYNNYSIPNMPKINCSINLKNRPVIILISRYTASSAEAVASGLKGHKNIILMGEQTSGASTTNSWIRISENVAFNPAVAYYMSEDKTIHKDGIIPDFKISQDSFDFKNPTQDLTIHKAIQLILK